jgi:hypothetical protein
VRFTKAKLFRGCLTLAFVALAVGPAWGVDIEVICAPDNDGDVPEVRAGDPLDVKVVFENDQCPFNQRGFCADASRTILTGGPRSSGCRSLDGDQLACENAWVDGGSGAASCFFDEISGACRGCGRANESYRGGLCTNTCRSEDAGSVHFSKLVVGLTGNANDSLGGLGIFGPFKTGISGRIPPAECSDYPYDPGTFEQVVRVVDKAPKRLAGTTAVVFAQVTVEESGAPVSESEASRKQEFCKVAIMNDGRHLRDDD